MATSKLRLHTSQLLQDINEFPTAILMFSGSNYQNKVSGNVVRSNGKKPEIEIQDGGLAIPQLQPFMSTFFQN